MFGGSGAHVLLAKASSASCLGVCWHYSQALIAHRVRRSAARRRRSPPKDTRPTRYGGGVGVGGGGGSRASPGLSTRTATATVVPGLLAAFYCGGLFSNSFIEAEDQLHRFLGTSSLLALAAVLLSRTDPGSPPGKGFDPTASSVAAGAATMAAGPAEPGTGSGRPLSAPPPEPHPARAASREIAAIYAVVAALCLRAAAAVQDASPGAVGMPPGLAFSAAASLLPLAGLWFLSSVARGEGRGLLRVAGRARVPAGRHPGGRPRPGKPRGGLGFHALLQALSLAAVGAYWVEEARGGGQGPDGPSLSAGGDPPPSPGFLLPMRLLWPRLAYALCLLGFVVACRPSLGSRPEPTPRRGTGGSRSPGEGAAAEAFSSGEGRGGGAGVGDGGAAAAGGTTAAVLITHMLPVVVVLLGPSSPPVVLLVGVACACVMRSVSAIVGMGPGAVPLATVAVTWSVVARAVFFLTGHHNQFSRLQYSAAFVGERLAFVSSPCDGSSSLVSTSVPLPASRSSQQNKIMGWRQTYVIIDCRGPCQVQGSRTVPSGPRLRVWGVVCSR